MYLSLEWDALPFCLVWNHIMLPCSHSAKIANISTLTWIFPDSSSYANLLEGSGNIEFSNLKIWPLTFHTQRNVYLTKNCLAGVLSSVLTIIPYVNFTRSHDCCWKKFFIFCVCQLFFSLYMLVFNNLELVKLKVIILTIWTKNYRRNCACVVSEIAEGRGKWWFGASLGKFFWRIEDEVSFTIFSCVSVSPGNLLKMQLAPGRDYHNYFHNYKHLFPLLIKTLNHLWYCGSLPGTVDVGSDWVESYRAIAGSKGICHPVVPSLTFIACLKCLDNKYTIVGPTPPP